MSAPIRIALVGDHDESITAHRAIPKALELAADALDREVPPVWLATDEVSQADLAAFDALWCVPGSPYRSMDGALAAIRFARENGMPFLGSCGGFQHAVIEYARHVLGWADADHAETAPGAGRAVIAPLACSLVEETETVRLVPGTRIATAYGAAQTEAPYRCRFGLHTDFAPQLLAGPLRAAAYGANDEVRAVELDGHRFFVATLFQSERLALEGRVPPLALALVRAAA
jgi:CTP synthase (UTP-ammonia lyase)